MSRTLDPYDAVLLISFGGPESPEEIMPFLRRVTAGRGVPEERLAEVAERYRTRGGVSPINAETRALAAALSMELSTEISAEVPLEIGNRNSEPFLTTALERLVAQGARRVLAVSTSAYPSYPSCRQYRENVAQALAGELQVDQLGPYAHHPGFAAANSAAVTAALATLPVGPTHLVFVTHSLPETLAHSSGPAQEPDSYVAWHRALAGHLAETVSAELGRELPWSLAFCSRSGAPHQSWLEPDVNDLLTELAAQGMAQVVLAPIGFTSDHMEVVWDLDVEAVPHAESLGLRVRRAETARTHPAFVHALAELLFDSAAAARGEEIAPSVIPGGHTGAALCGVGCCPAPARQVSRERPSASALPGSPRR